MPSKQASNRWLLAIGLLSLFAAVRLAWAQAPAAAPPPPGMQVMLGTSAESRLVVQTLGGFSVAKEMPLNRMVVSADKVPVALESPAPLRGPRQLTALVRLRPQGKVPAIVGVSVGRKDLKSPGLRLGVSNVLDGEVISCTVTQDSKPLHDLKAESESLEWASPNSNSLQYYPRAYSLRDIRPGWPDDYRLRIESDMAAMPDVPDKWLALRIEWKADEVRMWVDDRLVGVKRAAGLPDEGLVRVDLGVGTAICAFDVQPWQETEQFLPLNLGGYANSKYMMASQVQLASLGEGPTKTLGGVPFVLPQLNQEAMDHIDVGRSLYRQANMDGYLQSFGPRWFGSGRRDPARIQLRVPNDTYDALYLVAASDGIKDKLPELTAMFFRPSAGYVVPATAQVPLATAKASAGKAVPVKLANGKEINLWVVKVQLDPAALASFSDMDIVEIELTKRLAQFRSYPDPILYGYHQAGLPSGVHVYAATLSRSPLQVDFQPDVFGHVWTAPDVPSYTTTVTNRGKEAITGTLTVETKSYDGTEKAQHQRNVRVAPGKTEQVKLPLPVKLNGLHDVTATLQTSDRTWQETRSLCRLAPDTRAAKWTPGQGALFGYWSYHGGHYAPKGEHHVRLMTMAGARTGMITDGENPLVKKHWTRGSAGAWEVAPQPWAAEQPVNKEKYQAYQQEVIDKFTKAREKVPEELRPDHVYFFPEPHVSRRLSEGNYPEYWNGEPYQYDAEEQTRLRMFMTTAKAAAEAVRKKWPDLKILVPWGDPLFVVPLLRAGFPKDLIDGSGLDVPSFERLPEQQLHQNSIHRLYELTNEYKKFGEKPQLQFTEGIFVPTEVGAVSYREQMDIYHRWALISMAYGVDRFYSGWFAFDCGNYYGTEHYGGCGIQRRIPYCDPKPAYAAFATMTQQLDGANFDGWLPTGSHSTYCLRFKKPSGYVYALWTLRGKRPVTLTVKGAGGQAVDSMNNAKPLQVQEKQATVSTDPSVLYVTGAEVTAVQVGEPDNSDAAPDETAKQVADFGDGSWKVSDQRDTVYENGTFAMARYQGKFNLAVEDAGDRGKVLVSQLGAQDVKRELMPWYTIIEPKKPIPLPGIPDAIGVWVRGSTDWGRIIYQLKDAKGERWSSIGTQDQYNCDDIHSWTSFNFDGWRYLRFELPGHTGFDNFRKHGTTWWRGDGGDGVVDEPLALERVILEQRSHLLYVNDVQPAASDRVALGKVLVEYASSDDTTPEALRVSRLRMPLPAGAPKLPNPIADLERDGIGPPGKITKLEPPLSHNDGTLVHVQFEPVPEAKQHFIWGSVREDGRGAVNLTPRGAMPGVLIRGLRPAIPLHFWLTYVDAEGKVSKPSPVATATLIDAFKEK